MVGLFVRLKWRLLLNGFRTDTARLVGFLIGLVFALAAAGGCAFALTLLRGAPEQIGLHVTMILFTAFAIGWAFLPLFAFGTDETLDTARLAPLPLRRRRLIAGLLASSFVGIPPLATFLVLAGAVAGVSRGPVSIFVGVIALSLVMSLCVGLSRALSTSLSGLLRSRRGRDLALLLGVLLVFGFQAANIAFQRMGMQDEATPQALLDLLAAIAAPLRFTPTGTAARAVSAAADGNHLVVVGELAVTAGAVVLVLWWWATALSRALVGYDASTQATTQRRTDRPRRIGGRAIRVVPSGRAGAAAIKDLRYFWRDPQRKAGLIGAVAAGLIMSFAFTTGGPAGAEQSLSQVGRLLAPCFAALILGLQAANQFGLDGPAWWMNVVATASPRDFRTEIAGKNLAMAIVAVPLLLAISAVLAAFTDAPWTMATAFAVSCGLLGISLGASTVTSVLAPYPVPERRTNIFSSPGTGRGPLVAVYNFATFFATAPLAAPIVVPLFLGGGSLALVVLAPVYGATVAWVGRRIAVRVGFPRLPEMLGELSPTTAS